ncbi:hypothetical protein TNCV_434811 [Trichonephila clavipes]|nr:hypothetical protein TNCV_434811 [Trichonephila clavipes]
MDPPSQLETSRTSTENIPRIAKYNKALSKHRSESPSSERRSTSNVLKDKLKEKGEWNQRLQNKRTFKDTLLGNQTELLDLKMTPVLAATKSFHSDGSSVMDFMPSINELKNNDAECIFCKGKFSEDQRKKI